MSTWRTIARRVIEQALTGTDGLPEDEVVERIDRAYPFGERDYYPYKVWLEERRAAIAQLRGVHLPAGAKSPLATALVPLKPVPELEDWLQSRGRRAPA